MNKKIKPTKQNKATKKKTLSNGDITQEDIENVFSKYKFSPEQEKVINTFLNNFFDNFKDAPANIAYNCKITATEKKIWELACKRLLTKDTIDQIAEDTIHALKQLSIIIATQEILQSK